jgi:ribosomal protein L34E
MPRSANSKNRGVFEKVKGSGVWYVLYYDEYGKRYREKVAQRASPLRSIARERPRLLRAVSSPRKSRPRGGVCCLSL